MLLRLRNAGTRLLSGPCSMSQMALCLTARAAPAHQLALQCCILLSRGCCNMLKLGERALRQGFGSWRTPGCAVHTAPSGAPCMQG